MQSLLGQAQKQKIDPNNLVLSQVQQMLATQIQETIISSND